MDFEGEVQGEGPEVLIGADTTSEQQAVELGSDVALSWLAAGYQMAQMSDVILDGASRLHFASPLLWAGIIFKVISGRPATVKSTPSMAFAKELTACVVTVKTIDFKNILARDCEIKHATVTTLMNGRRLAEPPFDHRPYAQALLARHGDRSMHRH